MEQAGFAPLLQLRHLNPYLSAALGTSLEAGVMMPRLSTPWARGGEEKVACGGVSSFAFMGTNAHVIISQGITKPIGEHFWNCTHLLQVA